MAFKQEVYDKFMADANDAGDLNYCTVLTLCALTNWSYRKCIKHMGRWASRRYRKGCGSYLRAYEYAFGESNVVNITSKITERWGIKTVKAFEDNFENVKKGKYIIITSTHACAWVDGSVRDWAIDRQLRIREVYKVTGSPRTGTTKGVKMKHSWQNVVKPRRLDFTLFR